jgi:predicted RNase H-like HicB family nuclease
MKNTTTASNTLQRHILNCYQLEYSQGKEVKLFLLLRQAWQNWIAELKTNNDPKIWRTIDRLDNIWWHAYNPVTGCSATRESETEILEWIDRRITDGN